MKKAIINGLLRFTFDGAPDLVFDPAKAHAAVREQAQMHGWLQRLGDAGAIDREQKDGTVLKVTDAMRRERIAALVAHYESGTDQWNLRAPAAPRLNPQITALAAALGKTYAEAEAWLADKITAEIAAATSVPTKVDLGAGE
jgi:primosomal protein N'